MIKRANVWEITFVDMLLFGDTFKEFNTYKNLPRSIKREAMISAGIEFSGIQRLMGLAGVLEAYCSQPIQV